MAAGHDEGCLLKYACVDFVVCKGLSKDDVEVSRDRALQVIRPEDGFKTGHFVCYKLGGATKVEQLHTDPENTR